MRWGASFKDSYPSEPDGAQVSFSVRMPPRVENLDAYPLMVVLNGGPRVEPSAKFPFIQVRPTRTRSWGYRSLSTYDVMQVIATMKQRYPVDPDRIYLVGSSAGGSGAMHLASCFPDEFAALISLVAAGNNYPLANFGNLPVAFHHGDRDWTSAICNARVQTQRMREIGCPVTLHEYRSGHSVPLPHEPMMEWLLAQKRDPVPDFISHECEAPSLGRNFWVHIREFQDPHQRAYVEARISGETVTIRPNNIANLALNLEILPNVREIAIADQKLPAAGEGWVELRSENGRWAPKSGESPARRPYEAGAAANLFQGEPLTIVFGTAGGCGGRLKTAANKLANFGGSTIAQFGGRFPVIADRDLTTELASTRNLVLLGTPEENLVTKAIFPELPLKIANGVLQAGNRPDLPLKSQVLGLLHPHPHHPARLVYVLAPFLDEAEMDGFVREPQTFLAGSDGFDRISQPDLVVRNLDGQIARAMQFGKTWDWREFPDAEAAIPAPFADRANLARTVLEIMRRKAGGGYAMWWGPADPGMWNTDSNFLQAYNPDFSTKADFHCRRRTVRTISASVTGAELKDIRKRWVTNGELLVTPEIADNLEDAASYPLCIPMDLYIKLGRRNKNLTDPKLGPEILPAEVRQQVFDVQN